MDVVVDGESVSENLGFGKVACACREYPVVAGILIIDHPSKEKIMHYLDKGSVQGALKAAFELKDNKPQRLWNTPYSAPHFNALLYYLSRFKRLSLSTILSTSTYLKINKNWANYLKYRFASTSFLAAFPLMEWARRRHLASYPILDYCCGTGNACFYLSLLFPGCPLFCLDLNFTNLFIAHKYICPRAFCMQLDASKPLPFSSGTLDGVFSTDALHYLPDKALAAREIHRCLTSGGWAILSHNHNVNVPQSHDLGTALTIDGYISLFENYFDIALYNEFNLIKDGLIGRKILRQSPKSSLEAEEAFSMFLKKNTVVAKDIESNAVGDIDVTDWDFCPPLAWGKWRLNPLYRPRKHKQGLQLARRFPSHKYEEEYKALKTLFPEEGYLPQEWEKQAEEYWRRGFVSFVPHFFE